MTIMEELLEQNRNKNLGEKAAKEALDKVFGYTITQEQLNQLQHCAGELFNIGTHCQQKWDKSICSGTAEACEREGAFELLDKFYKMHYRLVNEIAGDVKIDGEVE
ncbi:MAG: hypothetical protein IJH63_02130 [Methanobrevibacter sp.]|nr:hypothetical protein [Methanobrevibacter sp.]